MILKEQFNEVFDPFIKKTLPGPHMNTGKTVCPNFSLHEDIRVLTYPLSNGNVKKNRGLKKGKIMCPRSQHTNFELWNRKISRKRNSLLFFILFNVHMHGVQIEYLSKK